AMSQVAETQPTRGSLWTPETQIGWFGADKAVRRGDTVLVKVVQKTSGSKQANTGTQRDSSISAKILYFLGFEKKINKLAENPANDHNLIDATSSSKFAGK